MFDSFSSLVSVLLSPIDIQVEMEIIKFVQACIFHVSVICLLGSNGFSSFDCLIARYIEIMKIPLKRL